MHEVPTPVLAVILTGAFVGFGLAGFMAWLTESDWGTGLLTILVGLAPIVWIFLRPSFVHEAEAGHGGITLTGDEVAFFVSLVVGAVLGVWMIRAADRGARQALEGS